ncbi:death domain-containing protein CRADD-like [Takifugu rubripes]|uniref:Death domain-containing protein CRADD n=1 Tax=Takifugu flavidus TaxID=433684 RepID=A0A5C6NFS2_9TELE|nr:death domain-containing protein CRADD-like [Takifugu rubripes]XP_056877835.1 death domain-containing protein CRADD [Takifugu flavidus]TWW64367.1 Death domain-containing protein CRADD [Takifugu flavidus]|eukprot:XP_003979439.1 PREDICTED: death domain-containing protein CRADD-like isoform X1 [Takifugu rubripes]
MEPEHRALLREHRLQLSAQLLVSDTIIPFLYQENVLTRTQVEEIESLATSRQKTLKLLDILPNCGPRAFHAFLQSLEDFRWIRDQLLLDLQERAGQESRDSWNFPHSRLQRVPSDQELSRLASRLGAEWESVLLDLGLSVETLFRCRADHSLSAHGAVLAGLVQWRRCGGKGATFQRLIQSLKKADVHPSVLGEVLT